MAFDTVNEVNVYTCTGQPLRSDIANIVEWMLNEDFGIAYSSILSNNKQSTPLLMNNNY